MTASYAFYFDAGFCSGCKACQAACKDKNNLPVGILWRRVYEVTGGGWTQAGPAWTNTVFAYNLSLACNHCVHPKCAGVCPVDAYHIREDGIVLLDSSKCIGCGYCAWACPYGAPQYDRSAGTMSKCNFCFDNIDAGLAPACTAACPMRALDFQRAVHDPEAHLESLPLWEIPASQHPYPLPNFSRTEPHLLIKPHAAMSLPLEKTIANAEEIKPQRRSGWEEAPLIVFSLLMQTAVGSFWAMAWMFTTLWNLVQYDSFMLRLLPLVATGLFLGLGLVASFAHLGAKKNAWRVIGHIKKSWLSREVLFTLLFGAGWLVTAWMSITWHYLPASAFWIMGLLGLGVLYSMAQVYHLRAVPAWNTGRTEAGFLISTLLLGGLLTAALLALESSLTAIRIPAGKWSLIGTGALLLLLARALMIGAHPSHAHAARLWRGLTLAGMLAAVVVFLLPGAISWLGAFFVFLIVLAEEAVGRWLFYEARG